MHWASKESIDVEARGGSTVAPSAAVHSWEVALRDRHGEARAAAPAYRSRRAHFKALRVQAS